MGGLVEHPGLLLPQGPLCHTGTFRGSNPSFVTATAALDFWQDPSFLEGVAATGAALEQAARSLCAEYSDVIGGVRGRGAIWGLVCRETDTARSICDQAFTSRLLVERSGRDNNVVKLMPALTITADDLALGLEALRGSIEEAAQTAARGSGIAPVH